MISDIVCLGVIKDSLLEYCIDPFDFYGITWQTGLEGLDGILGLSPNV
jgi:hypothetical protein